MFITKIANKIKTPFRRINHPEIGRDDIVIDIGCGPNPTPRANVTCDSSENDSERAGSLRINRPFVWAEINDLPFRDKAFDYSILSHVLEHLEDPARALKEVERVSKAGYIETPNAITEIAVPYTFHLSRVSIINGKLSITFKQKWNEELPYSYKDVTADIKNAIAYIMEVDWNRTVTQFKWKNQIDFEINGTVADFSKPTIDAKVAPVGIMKKSVVSAIYKLMRPRPVVLENLLASPCCKGSLVQSSDAFDELQCSSCKRQFKKKQGYWDFRLPR